MLTHRYRPVFVGAVEAQHAAPSVPPASLASRLWPFFPTAIFEGLSFILPAPRSQFSPEPSNTQLPTPVVLARTPPKRHRESPARSVFHPQNSALRMRILLRRPTILRNSAALAMPLPRFSYGPQNSYNQTPPGGRAVHSFASRSQDHRQLLLACWKGSTAYRRAPRNQSGAVRIDLPNRKPLRRIPPRFSAALPLIHLASVEVVCRKTVVLCFARE